VLNLAIKASLPLIAVTTRDTMNFQTVLATISKRTPVPYVQGAGQAIEKNKLYYVVFDPALKLALPLLYARMVKVESSLVIVNPAKIVEPMFNAGEVPVPRELMLKFMHAVVDDKAKAEQLMRGLGGCTLKEAAELVRLTMARDKSLTVTGLMRTRKSSFQASSGLVQVDTAQGFYVPPEQLFTWAMMEKQFFLTGDDPRLIPRGLLLDGPPGVGKTAASKWIASQFGVPLYRVDIGGTKNKYIGESEANLLTNLSRLDHEAPAVALLDECEKIFASTTSDTSGVTASMLSQLLWWLAERRSRVLVVMTTNNAKALPKELYREGRIDRTMWFGGLEWGEAIKFTKAVLKTFKQAQGASEADAVTIVKWAFNAAKEGDKTPSHVSQAKLTEGVTNVVKSHMSLQLTGTP
jgi:hypothetical protein